MAHSHPRADSMDFETDPMAPNYYSFMFQFEKRFQPDWTRVWMQRNWHMAFYLAAIYVVVIFGGQAFMANRPAFRLTRALTLWNVSLALFSIVGFLRVLPELLHVLAHHGLDHSVCNSSFIEEVKPSGFWTWMFALSKVPELIDTVFIVLRKQNLIFLHWYHHITVLLFTWFTYREFTSPARWFVNMNYCVHSLMYSYYALRALGFKIPKQMAMGITVSQILQMVMGSYVVWRAYYLGSSGRPCNITKESAVFGLLMYLSYFVLFARFFYQAYFSPKSKKFESSAAKAHIKKD